MRTIVLILALIILPFATHCQNFYCGIHTGYSLPLSRTVLARISTMSEDVVVYGGFGKGWNFSAYGGYSINERLGIELAANYHSSAGFYYTNDNNYTSYSPDDGLNQLQINYFAISPTIRIKSGGENQRFYLKQGISFGVGNRYEHKSMIGYDGGYQFTKSGGISYGLTSAFGITGKLSDHVSVFGELNCIYMNWAPTKGKYTKGTIYGTDMLSAMTVNEREVVYVDNLSGHVLPEIQAPSDQPSQQSKTYSPLSGAGLSVGLHVNF
ncbi:MAG: hypothetical protein M3R17_18685 [Bacteroidota bacterium]|nr:hypothetical protein [Bacteroidota bacterium]